MACNARAKSAMSKPAAAQRSATGVAADGTRKGFLKLPFVFRQRRACQGRARAHEIRGIGAEGADEPPGPLLAGAINRFSKPSSARDSAAMAQANWSLK